MTILTESVRAGEFIIAEGNGSISREEVTISAAAGALVAGTVMGKITASGKYVAYANGAADGSEVAAGILYAPAPDLAADQSGVIIARHAEVEESLLTGIDAPGKVDLAAVQIIFR